MLWYFSNILMQNRYEKLQVLAKMKVFKKNHRGIHSWEHLLWFVKVKLLNRKKHRNKQTWFYIYKYISWVQVQKCTWRTITEKYTCFFLVNKYLSFSYCSATPTKAVNFLPYCVFRNIWKSLFQVKMDFAFSAVCEFWDGTLGSC